MKILYEDRHLIAAVKPRGVSSQASGGQSMVQMLSEHTGGEIYCVHRLDTATGGVMVYAKTKSAAAALSAAFQKGETEKEYFAVVSGAVPREGELTDYLWHDRLKNKSFTVKTKRRGAKEARLSYTVIAEGEDCSLVKIRLFTGRTHQIRVQFASRGFPLPGDGKYGGKSGCPLALWCCRLTVPAADGTGRKLTFYEKPPEEEPVWYSFGGVEYD